MKTVVAGALGECVHVAGVLNFMGVDFTDVNVLADDQIRQGIKDYSDWPTIPQLYVKGEFVGGCLVVVPAPHQGVDAAARQVVVHRQ